MDPFINNTTDPVEGSVNIPSWSDWLQRNTVSQLSINSPYVSAFQADSMFGAGELSASSISSGLFSAVQTLGGANGNGRIDIDGQLIRILFTGSDGLPAIVLQA